MTVYVPITYLIVQILLTFYYIKYINYIADIILYLDITFIIRLHYN